MSSRSPANTLGAYLEKIADTESAIAADPAADDQETFMELCTLFEPNEDCICEFGDVILVVDDGFHPVEKLRVSSCILAMSSRVFKALFSKRYAEGLNGKDRSSKEPYEVQLQDAPGPMKQLCQLLHHQDISGSDEWQVSTITLFSSQH